MHAILTPKRYVLDGTQLAAVVTLSGLSPGPTSPLPELTPVPDAVGVLAGTALVCDGILTPEARATMAALAAPQRQLTVRVTHAGLPAWSEANLVRGPGEPVVAFSEAREQWDLALLPTSLEAALMVNELLQLTNLPSLPGGRVVDLDLVGYTALLAAADAVQTARLGARLAREIRPLPLLNAEVLEGMLERGLDKQDSRWAVTAGRLATPVDLRGVQGRMEAGLVALAGSGLMEQRPGGWGLTPAGRAIVNAFGDLIASGSLTLAVAGEGDQVTLAHTGIFRSAAEIWLTTWSDWGPGKGQVKLRHVSGATAVRIVAGLLGPD